MNKQSAPYTLAIGTIPLSITGPTVDWTFVDGFDHGIKNETSKPKTVTLSLDNGSISKDVVAGGTQIFTIPYGRTVLGAHVGDPDDLPPGDLIGGPIGITVTHVSGVGELTSGPDSGKPYHLEHTINGEIFRAETNIVYPSAPMVFSNVLRDLNCTYEVILHPITTGGPPGSPFMISATTTNYPGYKRNFWRINDDNNLERVNDPQLATPFHMDSSDRFYYEDESNTKLYLELVPYSGHSDLRKIAWGTASNGAAISRRIVPHNRISP